jgi:hypothetical protein
VITRRVGVLTLALVACALLLVVAGIGVWRVVRPPTDLFVVAGAVDVRVEAHGLGEEQITYRLPGQSYNWYFSLVRKLAADGWMAPMDRRGGLRNGNEVYWRISSLWLVYLKEEAMLQGEPNAADITLRREIIIPWRQYLP